MILKPETLFLRASQSKELKGLAKIRKKDQILPTTAIKWNTSHGKNKDLWLSLMPTSTKILTKMPMAAKTLSKMTINKSNESFLRFPWEEEEAVKASNTLSFTSPADWAVCLLLSSSLASSSYSFSLNKVYHKAEDKTNNMWNTRKNMATSRTSVGRSQQHCRIRNIMAEIRKKHKVS